MSPDVRAVAALMRTVAADEVLPRFRRLAAADISEKTGPQDLVTVADVAAEQALARELSALVPGSQVIGEEGASDEPEVFEALAGGAPVWLVDPVDGTANFVKGDTCFAMIVAYCVAGETRAGWILDPLNDVVAWAVAGQGAWTDEDEDEAGGRRLRLPTARPLAEMRGSLGWSLGKRLRKRVASGLQQGPQEIVRYKCTGREYMDLARGRLDFARYRRLKPWDHAAGVLMHAEAGGYSALIEDGRPYRPEPRVMSETVLLAPDRDSWRALRTSLDDAA